ncbi:MAG: hypothetical protein EA392_14005 [Cryomorphaceae bacterium]|nr:MAG: hypothetical protein EA392_14005 [Cryomorphaceae bacterium]
MRSPHFFCIFEQTKALGQLADEIMGVVGQADVIGQCKKTTNRTFKHVFLQTHKANTKTKIS